MIEVLKREYWSKSKAFLLPLTGMIKTENFEITTYVRWKEYCIEDYKLIVKVEYGHKYLEFQEYIKENILTHKNAFAREVYDFEGFSILIFDLSEWSFDVDMFLKGRYSRMSILAKKIIQEYHTFGNNNINVTIYSCLYPYTREEILDNMTAIDYVIEHYVLGKNPKKQDYETAEILKSRGELCSVCDFEKETLILETSQIDITPVLD